MLIKFSGASHLKNNGFSTQAKILQMDSSYSWENNINEYDLKELLNFLFKI